MDGQTNGTAETAETGAPATAGAPTGAPQVGQPFVSVIVTNYNYARFIEDCLASVLAQSYRNFECIIVDDRSSDGSPDVIRAFLAAHPEGHRARLHECAENGGQMAAFLEGFRRSSGAFVVFVDADDWLFPDFLETHLAAHLNPHRPAGLSCSEEMTIDGEGRLMAGAVDLGLKRRHVPSRLGSAGTVAAERFDAGGHALPPGLVEAGSASQAEAPLLHVAPEGNPGRHWIWTTTSAVMFRRVVLEIVLIEAVRDVRICADYFLLHYAHLVGGTLLIGRPCGCYRRHGANGFATSALIGTGAVAGRPGVDYARLWRRMRLSTRARFSTFCAEMGRGKAARLLAMLQTPATLPGDAATAASEGPKTAAALVFFALRFWLRAAAASLRRAVSSA